MWGSGGGGGREPFLSQTEGRCRQTLPGTGSPIFCVLVFRNVACHIGEAPWRRISSPCCLYPSFTLNFHDNHLICLFGVFRSLYLHSFTERKKMFWGMFLLSAVNPQKWGEWSECRVSLSPGRVVLTLQHAAAAFQLLKENWETQKSKRVTSASEVN